MAKYNLPQGFNITGEDPDNPGSGHLIDARFTVTSSADLYGFSNTQVAEGLTAYVSESQEYFILTDKSLYSSGNAASLSAWTRIDINISGSGLGLQGTLEGGNSASLGLTASFAHVDEVSFIGSSVIPIKLKKHATDDSIMVSGSGFVFESLTSTPTARVGGLMYSASNFYAGIV